MSHLLIGDSLCCQPRWCVDPLRPPRICVVPTVEGFLLDVDRYRRQVSPSPPAPLGRASEQSRAAIQAPRSATVRGLGAGDMLARNPRGEDTRWQSG